MSIETYTTTILHIYMGLFFLAILIGIVQIWKRIRKKPLKHWWGILPCSILYLIFAIFSTCIASIAYDDPADPNYARYENWGLHDFILHDIKTFVLWLSIGALLYFALGKKSGQKSIRTGCLLSLGCFTILFVLIILLSMITIAMTPGS